MMAKIELSSDLNTSLIEKVRCGKSPTPKDRRARLPYGLNKSTEDAKLKIQNDILDSLKEKDGIPPLVYPQDYIFDIAHFRTNGNLGELIDDMSNISNAEEKFEMVKSENKILRERLNNALQREMKAIKTFQKLANENRLLLLRLKEQGTLKKEKTSFNDANHDESYTFMNGSLKLPKKNHETEHNKNNLIEEKTVKAVNKSTSTSDITNNTQTKSTSTEDLEKEFFSHKDHKEEIKSRQVMSYKRNELTSQRRKALLKASSSPNIFEDFDGIYEDLIQGRARSASLGSHYFDNNDNACKAASSSDIDNPSGTQIFAPLRRNSEKRVCSVPSNLDVVDEEGDPKENQLSNFPDTSRSSISSEGTTSRPRSASSGSSSPCLTPSIEPEKPDLCTTESLRILHLHSRSLPSQLNRKHIPQTMNIDSAEPSEHDKKKSSTFSGLLKRRTTPDSVLVKRSAGSTRSLSTASLDKKYTRKGSSSDDSDKEENIPNARRRRTAHVENPHAFVAGIRKFQKMLSTGQLSHPSHESDNEEDILQACEAVSNQRYSRRRGSAVVQIPTSSVQMDLHVSTDEPIEDKKSRWASILKNKKKLILQKDKMRISEDLKEFLTNKTRSNRIDAETELLLYRNSHWTDFQNLAAKKNLPQSSGFNASCLTSKERKRREAVWELFYSEVIYLTGHLLVLKECFMEPLLDIQSKGFLVSIDHFKIFSNLEELCQVSAKFAKDLLQLFKNEQENQFGSTASVVAAFTKFKWTVHPQYERYCLGYTNLLNYLESLKQIQDVQTFLKWCESDRRCNRLKLTDLLVAPFQHLTKYPLLLKNIRKQTSEGDRQHAPLTSTIKSVEVLIQQLESNVTVVRNYRKLKELQKNLVWPPVADLDPKSFIPEFLKGIVSRQECEDIIASPKRELIYEGPLTLYENAKVDVFVFLFDDMLLLTKCAKKNTKHLRKFSGSVPPDNVVTSPVAARKAGDYSYTVLKQPVPIDRFMLHDLDDFQGNTVKHGFVLVHTSRFKQAIAIYTLQASSQDVKETWISKLKSTQNKWNEVIEQELESEEKNTDIFEKRSESRRSNDAEDEKTDSDIEHDNSSNNSSIEDYDDRFSNDDAESQQDIN